MAEQDLDLHISGGDYTVDIRAGCVDPENPDVRHSLVWWFQPVLQTGPEDARIEPVKFLHKRYTDACTPTSFEVEHMGEEIVESVGWLSDDLGMDDVPDVVIESLMEMFGADIVRRSVEHDGGEVPTKLYECVECDGVHEIPPRRCCPECGSDAMVVHQAHETIGENREVVEALLDAEVTTTVEEVE